MKCFPKYIVNEYLERFNEILCTMEYNMLCVNIKDNITKYFIECMIPHHEGAIYMSENLLNYTSYGPLIDIANNIIKMQKEGVERMEQIYSSTSGYENTQEDRICYTEKYCSVVNTMFCKMKRACKSSDINLNYINEMIPHHEGAIHMCKNLLKYNIDPRLKEEAETIISEQENGVKELKALISKI